MNSFFWLRKGEFRGIIIILFVSSLVLLRNHFRAKAQDEQSLRDFHRLLVELKNSEADSLGFAIAMDSVHQTKPIAIAKKETPDQRKDRIPVYNSKGPFDPNSLDDEGWKSRGLPGKNLIVLRNFQSKGGKFKTPQDLQKLYGWNEEWVRKAMKDVQINDRDESKVPQKSVEQPSPQFNLNLCDSAEFTRIKGIGPYYAGRLVAYRKALGGFTSIEQIQEMYGLREEAFDALTKNGYVKGEVKCISINGVSAEQLSDHPYVSHKQAKAIVNYRKRNGPFKDSHDLLKCVVLDEEDLHRLKPYLCFDDIGIDKE
ncbi:MAG: helix-hairpin-helix domain-containing protein [Flavobacteriales bacterium]|nr:helix-hairpin-helix domain-containing protein [Flavobacteriales bacterium]